MSSPASESAEAYRRRKQVEREIAEAEGEEYW